MKPIGLTAVTIVVLFATGLACAGSGPGMTEPGENNDDGSENGLDLTFSGSVQPIFNQRCALSRCHTGTSPAGELNLEQGQAHGNIVNVTGSVPTIKLIRPGLPDSSFLVHKIQGTQASVGGSGNRMPLLNCCLSQNQIDAIRAWIRVGARNN